MRAPGDRAAYLGNQEACISERDQSLPERQAVAGARNCERSWGPGPVLHTGPKLVPAHPRPTQELASALHHCSACASFLLLGGTFLSFPFLKS